MARQKKSDVELGNHEHEDTWGASEAAKQEWMDTKGETLREAQQDANDAEGAGRA